MNAIVKIEEQNVNVVEYKSLPVLTTAQLAEFYGTEQNNVHVNFTRNSERFIEGKHYFKLDGEELKQFKNIPTQSKYVPKQAARLILWTEKGAARHAKILDTDQAWNVFEQLEDCYFKAKEILQNYDPMKALSDPNALRGLLLGYSEKVIELESKVVEMTPTVEAYDRIAKADGSLCLTDAAKALQMRPKDFIAKLLGDKWIYKRIGNANWLGYQDKVQSGYLEHKVSEVTRGDGTTKISEQVRVTPKGLAKLSKEMK